MGRKAPNGCKDWHEDLIRYATIQYNKRQHQGKRDYHQWFKAMNALNRSQDQIFIQKGGDKKGFVIGIPKKEKEISADVRRRLEMVVKGEIDVVGEGDEHYQHASVGVEDTQWMDNRTNRDSAYAILAAMYVNLAYPFPLSMSTREIQANMRQFTDDQIEFDHRTRTQGAWKMMDTIKSKGLVTVDKMNGANHFTLTQPGLKVCFRLFHILFNGEMNANYAMVRPQAPGVTATEDGRVANSNIQPTTSSAPVGSSSSRQEHLLHASSSSSSGLALGSHFNDDLPSHHVHLLDSTNGTNRCGETAGAWSLNAADVQCKRLRRFDKDPDPDPDSTPTSNPTSSIAHSHSRHRSHVAPHCIAQNQPLLVIDDENSTHTTSSNNGSGSGGGIDVAVLQESVKAEKDRKRRLEEMELLEEIAIAESKSSSSSSSSSSRATADMVGGVVDRAGHTAAPFNVNGVTSPTAVPLKQGAFSNGRSPTVSASPLNLPVSTIVATSTSTSASASLTGRKRSRTRGTGSQLRSAEEEEEEEEEEEVTADKCMDRAHAIHLPTNTATGSDNGRVTVSVSTGSNNAIAVVSNSAFKSRRGLAYLATLQADIRNHHENTRNDNTTNDNYRTTTTTTTIIDTSSINDTNTSSSAYPTAAATTAATTATAVVVVAPGSSAKAAICLLD